MKTILAYGDSLTFGHDAETGGRHAYENRWPSALEAGLGGKARVIAEGLGGRTTVFDDFSAAADRNGARLLPTLLDTHKPLDLVILFLGTNDLKPYINGTASGAAMGVKRLIEIVKTHPFGVHPTPKVIVVSPPLTVATDHADLKPMFRLGAEEAPAFAEHYARIARDTGAGFFDAAKVAVATPLDGVHLDAANTRAIGAALVPLVQSTLGL